MSRSGAPADQWARAAAGWERNFFEFHITQCDDVDRLRAAAAYEAERDGETRPDRIARINQRLKEIDND